MTKSHSTEQDFADIKAAQERLLGLVGEIYTVGSIAHAANVMVEQMQLGDHGLDLCRLQNITGDCAKRLEEAAADLAEAHLEITGLVDRRSV